jgi:hypothetical protein
MADFDPPFAQDGERRFPTSTEQQFGFPCGEADRQLFNGMFHLLNGNVAKVIEEAGVTGPDGDLTKLYRSIEALIFALAPVPDTGGGPDFTGLVTMALMRARNPAYPETLTSDGRIACSVLGTGQFRIPGNVSFIHRGIFQVTTTQTDLNTDPSKVYHLRWNSTDGFVLRDLASGSYNPGTLAETASVFDSTYDDMLIARVVSNSSNALTITNLVNLNRMQFQGSASGAGTIFNSGTGSDGVRYDASFALNWARTPVASFTGSVRQQNTPSLQGYANWMPEANIAVTRYGLSARVQSDWSGSGLVNPNGEIRAVATA